MINRYLIFLLCAPSFVLAARADKGSKKDSITPINPKLTIIFVADSVPKGSINELEKFLKGGINFLRNNGINYVNVFHPNANCSSAQGHAGLTTGTFPSYHGMVNNEWIDVDGVSFHGCVQDNVLNGSAVYNPTNGKRYWLDPDETATNNHSIGFFYGPGPLVAPTFLPQGTGVSPRNYTVDNLSDQLMLFQTSQVNTTVYSISLDAETSTLMAGRLGKAIWMDNVSGQFTTSQYYFPNGIPTWVNQFNQSNPVPSKVTWNPVYPVGSAAYNFPDAQNYSGSALPELGEIFGIPIPAGTLFGKSIPSFSPLFGAGMYVNLPPGIQTYFKFVQKAIDTLLNDDPNSRLVLWLNVDCFDIFGGLLGTQTQEAIDIIYQIDQGLGNLIDHVKTKLPLSECLFVFCNDEGKYPNIPEILENQNFNLAMRTQSGFPITAKPPFAQVSTDLIARLNTHLIANLPVCLRHPWAYVIIPPFIYMNAPNPGLKTGLPNFYYLSPADQNIVIQEVIRFMLLQPGIKNAWSFCDLQRFPFEREDQGRFYKLHLFQNSPPINIGTNNQNTARRSGEVIFQVMPFNYVTSGAPSENPIPSKGVGHTSPYAYDSQTALYIYQAGRFANKTVIDPVLIQQVPITLSEILLVPRPSAASVNTPPLPYINPKKSKT